MRYAWISLGTCLLTASLAVTPAAAHPSKAHHSKTHHSKAHPSKVTPSQIRTPEAETPPSDAADANLKTGQKYLAEIAKVPGVVKLPSGVMYRVVSRTGASGAQPKVADTVTIDYEGKLIDGKVFDSSYARHEPAAFPLGRLVAAWQQVIPLMHVGDEVILYTPPSQAYGDRDMSPDIPPDSTLIFRVHLIGIGGQ